MHNFILNAYLDFSYFNKKLSCHQTAQCFRNVHSEPKKLDYFLKFITPVYDWHSNALYIHCETHNK